MENKELIQMIEQLKKENKALKEKNVTLEKKNVTLQTRNNTLETKNVDLEVKLEKTEVLLYETNKRLNEALLTISKLQEKEKIARTKLFIPKNEKLDSIVINETEEIIKEEKKKRVSNKGKKYNKKKFDYEKYVCETRIIEPNEKVCPNCGSKLVEASKKVRYVVEVIPSTIKVIKLIKKSMKCPNCNKEDNKVYYPLASTFNGSIVTPSLLSYILYHKYELGIPFEHLSNHITKTIGFEINKQNLANYASKGAQILDSIYEKMKEDLLNSSTKVIHSDETTLVVSKKPEYDKNRKKSYVYVYTSSYYDKNQIRIYDFHESRSIDQTTKWLKEYKGYLICDDYEGYDKLRKENPKIKLQRCWAHVRRRYADIVKNLPSKNRTNSIAYKILSKISALFKLEKEYRESKLTPKEIVIKRNTDMDLIKQELYHLVFNTEAHPSSALYEAIRYTRNCWEDLFTFLLDGHIEMTNNSAERAVKPFVVQRKVFQTSGSYAGAKVTTKIFSIIQTAKLNNINVEKYLNYVLNNINKASIDELLPYSKELAKKL
ncbi:MAG: IS66 family transposase [Roseburia sp.]|nr:IS66 family transposase [Roseburia sp.]